MKVGHATSPSTSTSSYRAHDFHKLAWNGNWKSTENHKSSDVHIIPTDTRLINQFQDINGCWSYIIAFRSKRHPNNLPCLFCSSCAGGRSDDFGSWSIVKVSTIRPILEIVIFHALFCFQTSRNHIDRWIHAIWTNRRADWTDHFTWFFLGCHVVIKQCRL